jgi:polyisoprenyl-phosphate glycosyltransferase
VVEVLRGLPERTRFVRGLRSWAGFRQIGIPYERHARYAGNVKYTFSKLLTLAFDGIVSFSHLPLRLAAWTGLGLCLLSLFSIGAVIIWWAADIEYFGMRPHRVLGWTSLVLLTVFLAGTQMLLISILGEYLARVYDEVKARQPWVVSFARGFECQDPVRPLGWYVAQRGGGHDNVESEPPRLKTAS